VVFHEEALYQVYLPLPFTFILMNSDPGMMCKDFANYAHSFCRSCADCVLCNCVEILDYEH